MLDSVYLCLILRCSLLRRFVTTPLLLLDLMLTAGLPWPSIIWTIFLDIVMVVTGLLGALVKSRYKWGTSSCCVAQRIRSSSRAN